MAHKNLLSWYLQNHRLLPWRGTNNPYVIWLSEIILQQTRVAQGLPYFNKFLENFPDIHSLAHASEEKVLKLWQGLGYYSRGRNLHFTAKFISTHLLGVFPTTYHELLKLKGIGNYTAAAIASFAYNEPVAVLDGNVFRVLSRYFLVQEPINTAIGKKIFETLAQEFLNLKNPALHNQAMMELGALVCLPQNPDCNNCPLKNSCKAFGTAFAQSLPNKLQKAKAKEKFFFYLHLSFNKEIGVVKRPKGGIWQNLYDLPLLSYDVNPSNSQLQEDVKQKFGLELTAKLIESAWHCKHLLTHQKIQAVFIRFEPNIAPEQWKDYEIQWVNESQLSQLPVSRLLEKYLQHIYG